MKRAEVYNLNEIENWFFGVSKTIIWRKKSIEPIKSRFVELWTRWLKTYVTKKHRKREREKEKRGTQRDRKRIVTIKYVCILTYFMLNVLGQINLQYNTIKLNRKRERKKRERGKKRKRKKKQKEKSKKKKWLKILETQEWINK